LAAAASRAESHYIRFSRAAPHFKFLAAGKKELLALPRLRLALEQIGVSSLRPQKPLPGANH